MIRRLSQGLLILAAGFTLAVFATGIIDLVKYLRGEHPYILAVLPIIIIFGTCILGWIGYGLWSLYDSYLQKRAQRKWERMTDTRTFFQGAIDRNVQ